MTPAMDLKPAQMKNTCNTNHGILYAPNKGGTTEGGFLLTLYRITPVGQDFRSASLST